MPSNQKPALRWESGTGYDFFISLHVLHNPSRFALRGAWAKGVRSRLPPTERAFFEQATPLFLAALPWVHSLPDPKDGETVLDAYAQMPPNERVRRMLGLADMATEERKIVQQVAARGEWGKADRDRLLAAWQRRGHTRRTSDEAAKMLELWARAPEYGERSLEAFLAYYRVFFAEEEARIRPALAHTLQQAQARARHVPLQDLLESLSEGIRFERTPETPGLVMVPSFWISPLIILSKISPAESLFVFGGRPAEASLVPGEAVPDALYRALKALADPTRLRILRYLAEKPQTPTELACRLRLRAPTVIHHLNTLRLAGLVHVTVQQGERDKRYAARTRQVAEMYAQLRRYLKNSEDD